MVSYVFIGYRILLQRGNRICVEEKGVIVRYKDSLEFGNFYHIYNRGNNHEAIFKEEKNYFYFLDLFKKYINPISDVYAFCLLPTHFHFMLRIKDSELIGEYYQDENQLWMQFRTFLGTYTKAVNKMYSRSGHLFDGRYSRKLIENDNYFFQLIQYIHQNPQVHGVVSNYQIWPFSSYQAYVSMDLKSILFKGIFHDEDLYNTIMGTHENDFVEENAIGIR